jgi:Rnl2 family RNA ligase
MIYSQSEHKKETDMTETLEKKFYSYPSIENSYRDEFIEKIRLHGFENKQYYVTEKIHGSNTQLSYDGKEFEMGTRSHYLIEGEKCYNVQPLLEQVKDMLQGEYNTLKDIHPELKAVIIFGEVFGGHYPHKEVKQNNHASKVQKGVWYSPDNEWYAFDLCWVDGNDNKHFLPGYMFITQCEFYNIPHVPVLKVCNNLTEALEYPNNEPSVVAVQNGLPAIDDNIMEGVVIKPYTQDLWMGQTRVIIKNKNEKFKEKSHEKRPDIQKDIPENVKTTLEQALQFVNENRVHNVISHLGEVTYKDTGRVICETNKDVLAEVEKEVDTYNTLEKAERKEFTRMLNSEVAKVVRKVMAVR